MEFFIIALVALFASALTLFSGFGLGTILLPVFAVFFPLEVAISITAIVHFLNNIFKLSLTVKNANRSIILQFGIPSLIAAIIGAYCLSLITNLQPLMTYHAFGAELQIMPVKLIIASIILIFSLYEIIPFFSNLTFNPKYLFVGGLLSGFFGGLSGNQGALRSAFLIKANLSKEAYIASGIVIACMVDLSRLSIYSNKFFTLSDAHYPLIFTASLAAFVGAYIGNKLVKKVTIKSLQMMVSIMLILFSILLGMGVI